MAHEGEAQTDGKTDWSAEIRAWLRHRDDEAARRLMAEFYPFVLSIVRTRLPRRMNEEDLAQEVFIRVFDRLASYDGRAPLKHWISRVAVNVCLDQLRAEKRRPELRWADLSEGEAEVLDATLAAKTDDSSSSVAATELAQKLLAGLNPEERLVIEMLDLEGRTSSEVEALTGMSSVAIRVRAFRARRKLRKVMEKLDRQKI